MGVLQKARDAANARAIMPRETPRNPVVLERFAAEVAANLGSKPLGEARVRRATLDLPALAAELEAGRTGQKSRSRHLRSRFDL